MSSKPGFWRKCRIALRCARFTVWALVLLLLASFAWFNLVGLPGFLKTRLVMALRDRGVQLEFSRLRVRAVHGLVCDDVRVGAAGGAAEPVFTAREVQLRINYVALAHLRLQVDGLVMRDGRFNLSPAFDHSLALTNLQGQLRILPEDTWSLDELTGGFAGTVFNLGGEVVHAPECRHWQIFATPTAPARGNVEASLDQFSETLKQIQFSGKPQLNASLNGDARDVHSFSLRVNGNVPGVQTPWFATSNLEFAVRVLVPTNVPATLKPEWDYWTNLQPFHISGFARCADLAAGGLRAKSLDCAGTWAAPELALTNCAIKLDRGALNATGKLDVDSRELTFAANSTIDVHVLEPLLPASARRQLAIIAWTAPPRLEVRGSFVVPAWTNQEADWPEALIVGGRLNGGLALTNVVVAGRLPLDSLRTHFSYQHQVWKVRDLDVTQGRSSLAFNAEENDTNQDFHCAASGTLDSALIRSVLTDSNALRTFDHLRFNQPLALALDVAGNLGDLSQLSVDGRLTATNFARLRVGGQLVLPGLTNPAVLWPVKLGLGSRLEGEVALTNLLVGGVLPLEFFQTRFHYDQQVWGVQDLKVSRGRSTLALSAELNEKNLNFQGRLNGQVDPDTLRTFLNPNAARGFECLHFHEPVALALAVTGNLNDLSTLSATGRVALTNFVIREQRMQSLSASLSYSNLTAEFYHPQLVRTNDETFEAERATLDLSGPRLWLHHGRGRVLPAAVAAAIGPQTAAAMAPYQFLAIPEATVEGCIPLKFQDGNLVSDDADLRFNVVGTIPFRWRRFETPTITGTIHWLGHDLIITNATAACYEGVVHGWGVFDLETPGDGTDFSFFMDGTNVDLNAMGLALWSPTNQLRGALSGQIAVTSANSSDWRTWNGYGQVQLQNGMLWNAPVLGGLMSPVLNTITPGLDIGNSRATDGAGSFTMTNGVIFTDSLVIRSLTMRFDYVGTVDLDLNVSARVKAQLLRNTPVLGMFFSTLFLPLTKVFECDVTGTLDEPKIKPAFIPFVQYLTAPLHPIRTVEKIFLPSPTNGPPKS
jgi:hypothetical protein